MDFDEYQRLAEKTATFDPNDRVYSLMYLSMGLAGESGEVIEKLKKVVRNDGGEMSEEKRREIAKELGDVLWYLSQFARVLNVPFNEVAEANIKKLSDRAERGVIKSEGDNR